MYRLSCSCGRPLEVSPTQAGSLQVCPRCGAQLEVPTLRALRSLPQAEGSAVSTQPPPTWGLGRGITFAAGLLLSVTALLALGLVARHRGMLQVGAPDLRVLFPEDRVEHLTPSQVWEGWVKQLRDERLEGRTTPPFLENRRQYRQLTAWMFVCGALAAAGMLLASGAALLGRKRRPTARRPAEINRAGT